MNNTNTSSLPARLRQKLQTLSWEPWLLLACGGLMAHLSWLKWADLVIDFGEQAYIAWRLAEGAVLYRDIVYFYGPLSSYLHALLFKLFGTQLMVLIVFNLFLVAVLTVTIYRLFLVIGSRLSALVAGLTFLIVFAFAQYLWMGNHNFICSYVYDVTHGIVLSFLAAGQFVKFANTRQSSSLIFLGLLSGLVLLTKIEVSLAWTTAVLAGLFLQFRTWNLSFREGVCYWTLFGFGLIVPFVMFTAYFVYHMGWSAGWQAMLGPWTYVLSSGIGSLKFYQSVMGTDALGKNLMVMVKYSFFWALLLAALAAINHTLRKPMARFPILGMLAILLFLLSLQLLQSRIPWLELMRPLPFILLGASVWLAFKCWHPKDDSCPLPALVLITLTIFATVLLLKIFFKTHVYHYGAALAMPATLLFFKFLIDDAPYQLKKLSGDSLFFKGAVIAGISLLAFNHFLISAGFYGKKVFPVASGGDTLVSYHPEIAPRALFFQIALDILNKEMQEGETLATLPTGTLLNYFARKPDTIESISYNPGTETLLGESGVLRDFRTTPPTYIAIVYHDYLEFGDRFFGKDFGTEIYQWIKENYVSVKLIGKEPVEGKGFGIHLYRLKTAPAIPPEIPLAQNQEFKVRRPPSRSSAETVR